MPILKAIGGNGLARETTFVASNKGNSEYLVIPAMYYTNEVTHLALCKCSNHSVDHAVGYTQYSNPVMIIQNAPYPLQAILCRCLKHVMCKHNTGQDIFLLVLHVIYLYMLYVYYFDGRIAVSV